MIYILIYLGVANFFVGQYWGDSFNKDSFSYKITFSFLLFLFSPALFILKYLFLGIEKIIPDIVKFYWRLYITKEYNNMDVRALKMLNDRVAIYGKDRFYMRGLKLINKRNNYTPIETAKENS